MNNEAKLKEYLQSFIKQEIANYKQNEAPPVMEISTTDSGAGGYLTPGAFSGKSDAAKSKKRKLAQVFGYTLSPQGERDLNAPADRLESVAYNTLEKVTLMLEGVTNTSATVLNSAPTTPKVLKPHQKIGKAISSINSQIKTISDAMQRQRKLKVKENVNSSHLWKRTISQLHKLESRLLVIAHEIRELRQ